MNAHVEAFLSTFISVGDNDVLLVQLSIKYHQFSLIKKSRPTVDLWYSKNSHVQSVMDHKITLHSINVGMLQY